MAEARIIFTDTDEGVGIEMEFGEDEGSATLAQQIATYAYVLIDRATQEEFDEFMESFNEE